MNSLKKKIHNSNLRKNRVRAKISGTPERPRLSARISNLHVSAQIIDDTTHQTIASVTTVGQKTAKGNLTEKATWVGNEIAKKAKANKVKQVAFDRGDKKYHGRIKALADAARAGGLEF
ncbi:50S ribosomal protein L18 [Candidatus Saccharibacteria bacterium]|nr:50S ribosomal protein L18 [Candidatus Saccharibacteria bacterium]